MNLIIIYDGNEKKLEGKKIDRNFEEKGSLYSQMFMLTEQCLRRSCLKDLISTQRLLAWNLTKGSINLLFELNLVTFRRWHAFLKAACRINYEKL